MGLLWGSSWPLFGRPGVPWASSVCLPLKIMKNWRSITGKRAASSIGVHQIEPPGTLRSDLADRPDLPDLPDLTEMGT